MVWKKFKEEMGVFFGTRIAFLLAIVYTIMIGLARGLVLGRSSSMNFFLEILIDAIIVGVPTFIFLTFLILLRAPYRAGKELQEQLDILEDKWGGARIRKPKIFMTPQEETEGSQYLRVWLKVENKEGYDLESCSAELRGVKIWRGESWEQITENVIKKTRQLNWPFVGQDQVIVRAAGWERLNVALVIRRDIYGDMKHFTFKSKSIATVYGSELEPLISDVYFEIGLNGTMNGKPIEEVSLSGFLRVDEATYPNGAVRAGRFYIVPGRLTLKPRKNRSKANKLKEKP